MGILKVTFCTKMKKTKKFETLTHGDFDNIFKKKLENQHFQIILDFTNMRIWTILSPKSQFRQYFGQKQGNKNQLHM